jgi:predicted RNase H-like HicB family nuclease
MREAADEVNQAGASLYAIQYQSDFGRRFAPDLYRLTAETGELGFEQPKESTIRSSLVSATFGSVQSVYTGARTLPIPRQFDVMIERDAEGYYVVSAPQVPGCHTQARSLDAVNERIREAIEVCLEVQVTPEQDLEFIGIQRVTVAELL